MLCLCVGDWSCSSGFILAVGIGVLVSSWWLELIWFRIGRRDWCSGFVLVVVLRVSFSIKQMYRY